MRPQVNRERLARSLRKARLQSRLTMREVAERAEVSVDAIRGYEKGRCMPGLEALVRLSSVYDIDIGDLLQHVDDREHDHTS